MRIGLVGDTGSGKTLVMVKMLYEYHIQGYQVLSNVDLDFSSIYVDEINIDDKTDNKTKNIVGIDEIGEEEAGKPQIKLSQLMAQSRKSIGEHSHMILTFQIEGQTRSILRGLLDCLVYPRIILRADDNKPIFIELEWFTKLPKLYPPKFVLFMKERINVYDFCNKYNTFQKQKPLKDLSYMKYVEQYKDYIGERKKLTKLSILIRQKEGVNKATSKEIAISIINAPEFYPELFEKK